MPMTGAGMKAVLKPAIKTQLESQYQIVAGFGAGELEKFAEALATAIGNQVVSYIQANALVSGTVTSGNGAGGAVTGTVS